MVQVLSFFQTKNIVSKRQIYHRKLSVMFGNFFLGIWQYGTVFKNQIKNNSDNQIN